MPVPAASVVPNEIVTLDEALAALAAEREKVLELTRERDHLRTSHERLRLELELLKRRIFIAKAERVDTRQLEMEFAATLAELDRLAGTTPAALRGDGGDGANDTPKGPRKAPTGRRDLRTLPLEEERVEIPDPIFEKLVAEGRAERFELESSMTLAGSPALWRQQALVLAPVPTGIG